MRPPAALRVGDAFCATTSALRVIENVIRTDKDPEKRELIVLKLRALLHEATTSDAAVQATRPAMWEHADVDTPLCMKEPPGPLPSLCQLYNGEHQAPPWISSARCTCLSCGQPATCTDKRCTSERGFSMVLGEDPMRKLETGFLEARRVQRARFRTRLRLLRCRIFLSRHDSIRHRLEYERHRLELAELRERMCALADKLSRQLPPPPPAPHTAIAEATAPKSLGKLGFSSYLQSIGTKRKGKQLLRPIETPDTANMLNESTVGALRRATLSHGNLDLSITQPARTGSAAMSAQSDVACDTASNTSDSCPDPADSTPPALPPSLLNRTGTARTAVGSALAMLAAPGRYLRGAGSIRKKMEFSTLRGQRDELDKALGHRRIASNSPQNAPVGLPEWALVSDDAVSSW